jgi:hypothetical protein
VWASGTQRSTVTGDGAKTTGFAVPARRPLSVIPAQAGIHLAAVAARLTKHHGAAPAAASWDFCTGLVPKQREGRMGNSSTSVPPFMAGLPHHVYRLLEDN